jgi:hypothetical protein
VPEDSASPFVVMAWILAVALCGVVTSHHLVHATWIVLGLARLDVILGLIMR